MAPLSLTFRLQADLRSPETCCFITTTPTTCDYYHVRPSNPPTRRLSPHSGSVGQHEEAYWSHSRPRRRLHLVVAHSARCRPSCLRRWQRPPQRWALALVEERGSRGVHPTSLMIRLGRPPLRISTTQPMDSTSHLFGLSCLLTSMYLFHIFEQLRPDLVVVFTAQ